MSEKNNISILVTRGSATARGGFKNERDVAKKFNDWKNDMDAKTWLEIMGYKLNKIERVYASQITGSHKTDVQVQIKIILKDAIGMENISIKLVSNPQGFNQIDKRWVNSYSELWAIPAKVVSLLEQFTGESHPNVPSPRDRRRLFFDELKKVDQNLILDFFKNNKVMIISDIFKGRDALVPGWMLIYQKNVNVWSLLPIALVMNFYAEGEIIITSRGSLKIGRVGMQRKGGDAGRETAKMLQFKFNPCEIVNENID